MSTFNFYNIIFSRILNVDMTYYNLIFLLFEVL